MNKYVYNWLLGIIVFSIIILIAQIIINNDGDTISLVQEGIESAKEDMMSIITPGTYPPPLTNLID